MQIIQWVLSKINSFNLKKTSKKLTKIQDYIVKCIGKKENESDMLNKVISQMNNKELIEFLYSSDNVTTEIYKEAMRRDLI